MRYAISRLRKFLDVWNIYILYTQKISWWFYFRIFCELSTHEKNIMKTYAVHMSNSPTLIRALNKIRNVFGLARFHENIHVCINFILQMLTNCTPQGTVPNWYSHANIDHTHLYLLLYEVNRTPGGSGL